jgi:hypothetical protein
MPLGGAVYRSEKNNGGQICPPKISLEQAADLLNVARRTVVSVKAVAREAPELVERIERGEMTAHEAEKTMQICTVTKDKAAELLNVGRFCKFA